MDTILPESRLYLQVRLPLGTRPPLLTKPAVDPRSQSGPRERPWRWSVGYFLGGAEPVWSYGSAWEMAVARRRSSDVLDGGWMRSGGSSRRSSARGSWRASAAVQ